MQNEKQARHEFNCSKCFKSLQLQQHVYKKAYEGHDTCLSCRTVDIADNVLTEEDIKHLETINANSYLSYAAGSALISSHRTLNSRNAKLVHENDELMAENEKLKAALIRERDDALIWDGITVVNRINKTLEEINHE